MRITILFTLIALASCKPGTAPGETEQWIPLFNGRDLEGWEIKFAGYPLNDNYLNTFRVEEGLMTVSYENYDTFSGEFGHIFYKEPFSSYKLRIEYRIIGEQVPGGAGWAYKNNGAMLHSQSAGSMGLDQSFPVSIEAQFLGGTGEGHRPTANLCTPGTHVYIDGELITRHCTESKSKTYHGEDWVSVELVVLGDSIIHHLVEGDTVLTYTKPHIGGDLPEGFTLPEGSPLKEGYIALQAESHPFQFRKVELLRLDR